MYADKVFLDTHGAFAMVALNPENDFEECLKLRIDCGNSAIDYVAPMDDLILFTLKVEALYKQVCKLVHVSGGTWITYPEAECEPAIVWLEPYNPLDSDYVNFDYSDDNVLAFKFQFFGSELDFISDCSNRVIAQRALALKRMLGDFMCALNDYGAQK